jgi:hypothetical protein
MGEVVSISAVAILQTTRKFQEEHELRNYFTSCSREAGLMTCKKINHAT